MKVNLKASVAGFNINETVTGNSAEEIVTNLRTAIAKKIPRIPFTKKDDEYRDGIKPVGEKSWPNTKLFQMIVEYYNTNMIKKDEKPYAVPKTAAEFLDLATKTGMAKIIK